MCGIVAILGQPAGPAPKPEEVLAGLERALVALEVPAPAATSSASPDGSAWIASLSAAATALDEVDAGLRTDVGVRLLVEREDLCGEIEERVTAIDARLNGLEGGLDVGALRVAGGDLERLNAALVRAKDAAWAVAWASSAISRCSSASSTAASARSRSASAVDCASSAASRCSSANCSAWTAVAAWATAWVLAA